MCVQGVEEATAKQTATQTRSDAAGPTAGSRHLVAASHPLIGKVLGFVANSTDDWFQLITLLV